MTRLTDDERALKVNLGRVAQFRMLDGATAMALVRRGLVRFRSPGEGQGLALTTDGERVLKALVRPGQAVSE